MSFIGDLMGLNAYWLIERPSWNPSDQLIAGPWDRKKDARSRKKALDSQGHDMQLVKAVD